MIPKKRGRPLGKETLEKLRIEKMMREIPTYLPRLTSEEKAELEESIQQGEEIRLEILKTYKHGSWTPDEHAYSMASLGDESFEGHEQKVLDDDARYSQQAKKYRADAGTEIKKCRDRQRKAWNQQGSGRKVKEQQHIQPSPHSHHDSWAMGKHEASASLTHRRHELIPSRRWW